MHMVRKVSSVSYRECEKILSAACVGDDESGKEVREFVISAVNKAKNSQYDWDNNPEYKKFVKRINKVKML